uniref:Retrovirus-related Pol polyprotein from transposon TNT 1-94 n=1 Tax=Tanacetum cinerariifolium TaxID=118510 RepID=A0A6L2KRC6_TANCI|nr:retrovirus-related Pol polyprotein from transposon TNT 1-94 [Tanacetum cinerariifolium]
MVDQRWMKRKRRSDLFSYHNPFESFAIVEVSAATRVSTAYAKMPVSSLLNIVSLSNAVLICLKWSVLTATKRDILLGNVGLLRIPEGMVLLSHIEEEEPANFALMAFLALSSSSDTELSPSKPAQDLSHINRPTAPIIEDWVSDSEDESEAKAPQIVPSFVQSSKQVKTPRYSVYPVETSISAVLTQIKPVSITTVRPVSAAVPKIMVTRPRLAHSIVTKSKSPIRRYITHSQSPKTNNLPPRVTAVQASVVSAAQGNPKGGKISGKRKIKTGKLDFNDVYLVKGIKREFSIPRTPQQNGIAKRKNMTLIEAARTMLTDLLLPIPFWAEAVNTAFYVQNRVLVTKPHNKTPYELLHGQITSIGFMRPFGCPVTILNTLDSLGKFEGKVDEGFLVGYSVNSKAFRVFNSKTHIIQETLHVNFLENRPNIADSGPTWLFDIDSLTRTMNYQPVTAGNQTNPSAGFQEKFDAEKAGEEINQQYVLFPVWSSGSTNPQNYDGDAAFDEKEHNFDAKKPESEVIISPSNSAQSRKQDDKTKKEAKGKSHVKSFT